MDGVFSTAHSLYVAAKDMARPSAYAQHPHRTMHVRLGSHDPEGRLTGSDQDFHSDDYSHTPGGHDQPRVGLS
jgi:hypothetical protein